MISKRWKGETHQSLSVGIVIYSSQFWGQGMGRSALGQWFDLIFADHPQLEQVGLTTWSRNARMMAFARKLGMTQEARIRKVRCWQGKYYDSICFGRVRSEWERPDSGQ